MTRVAALTLVGLLALMISVMLSVLSSHALHVPPTRQRRYPKLEARLEELALAPDPSGFAQEHGLRLEGGRVRVLIDLEGPDVTLPPWVTVEVRGGGRLQALVPVQVLGRLSEQAGVRAVTLPVVVDPMGPAREG